MHAPFPGMLSCILSLLTGTLAQDESALPFCQNAVGPSGVPICCDAIISRGPTATCPGGELVDDIANCTIEKSPTGWARCVESEV
jgi:hypothetical protein